MKCPVNIVSYVRGFKNSGSHKHYGIDLGYGNDDGKNQPVYACDDGIVIYNRHQISGGYVIHLKHNNGFVSEYAHLLKDSQLVHEGDHVNKGQQIASMGSSGLGITGMHLHFGIYKGSYINYGNKSGFVNPLELINVYDNQVIIKGDFIRTKHAKGIPSEPLLIHNQTNYKSNTTINGLGIYNNQEVETYGLSNGMNCLDNTRNYYCSNRYLK